MFRVYYTVYEHAGTKARGPSVLIGSLCALRGIPAETLTTHCSCSSGPGDATDTDSVAVAAATDIGTYACCRVSNTDDEIIFKYAAVNLLENNTSLHITDSILIAYTRLYIHNSNIIIL